jgi:Cu/Ag efflux protein CusF
MKKIILLLLIAAPLSIFSQKKDGSFEKEIQYSSSKDDAFTNTLIWAAETFNNSNEVIKMKDKDSGIIIIKGAVKGLSYRTTFTMTFRFNDDVGSVKIKNWGESKFKYSYNGFDNCYTRSCKKNLTKWMAEVNGLGEKLISDIEF